MELSSVLEIRIALAKLGFGPVLALALLGVVLILKDEGKLKRSKVKSWFDQQTVAFMSLFAGPPKKRP